MLVAGKQIAVAYLARMKEPFSHFEAFAKSYAKFDAGIDHDLVVIVKGRSKIGERAVLSGLFSNKPRLVEVSDYGVDIHAYLKTAKVLENEFVVFLNTFSLILSEGWLAKLADQLFRPDAGLVGASGSYESVIDSCRLLHKAFWLVGEKKIRFNEAIAREFFEQLRTKHWDWVKPLTSFRRRIKRRIRDFVKKRPYQDEQMERQFAHYWHKAMIRGNFSFTQDFSSFPNPHIRSNCFGINRQALLDLGYKLAPSKTDALRFESGADGLTRRIRAGGKRAIIVGANGVGYDVEDWPKSGTYKLGHQENLLASDNQTRAFDATNGWERALAQLTGWGNTIAKSAYPLDTLGIRFEADAASLKAPTLSRSRVRPKFSIVIPTHNRPDLLREAIETVRRQSYDEWELIVFDNASSVPTAECVDLSGNRIFSSRSDTALPVTDSWNTAIDRARGDYVTLIGDDDGLLPGYFDRMRELAESFDNPELIYSSILQFFHPGVAPWQRFGYVADVRNGFFFSARGQPFRLGREAALKAVRGSLDLRRNFTFNMQAFCFRRDFLDRLRSNGKVFLSPFPDYYLANVAFGLADTIVVEPTPLAIAGVSRASYGYTMFNKLEDKGAELLKTDLEEDPAYRALKARLLPGPSYNINYIATMQHVVDRLGPAAPAAINVERFRQLQIFSVVTSAPGEVKQLLLAKLSPAEQRFAAEVEKLAKGADKAAFEKLERDMQMTDFHALIDMKDIGGFDSTTAVFEAVELGGIQMLLPERLLSEAAI